MPLPDEDVADLIADLERVRREKEIMQREKETMQQEKEAMQADFERAKREVGTIKAKTRECDTELERLQKERSLGTPLSVTFFGGDDGAVEEWLQSDRMGMPMFSLSEGPQQSARTAVALAAAASAAETMTGTRVFPDTAAPDASVARAAIKLTSAAGSSSTICGEKRVSTGTLFPLAVRYYNSSWPKHGSNSNNSNSSNSSSNDTTSNYGPWWDTTCVVELLRPSDPGKGCQRDARRGRAVLGVDLPFDRGKA